MPQSFQIKLLPNSSLAQYLLRQCWWYHQCKSQDKSYSESLDEMKSCEVSDGVVSPRRSVRFVSDGVKMLLLCFIFVTFFILTFCEFHENLRHDQIVVSGNFMRVLASCFIWDCMIVPCCHRLAGLLGQSELLPTTNHFSNIYGNYIHYTYIS